MELSQVVDDYDNHPVFIVEDHILKFQGGWCNIGENNGRGIGVVFAWLESEICD